MQSGRRSECGRLGTGFLVGNLSWKLPPSW
jgi:hypothetical protein